jgi:membrane-bound serine protease (ClpP class)
MLALMCLAWAPGVCRGAAEEGAEKVSAWTIRVDGPIKGREVRKFRKLFESARAEGVGVVVVELNTPGGYFTDASDIADVIFHADGIRSVALVTGNALSGGAIIALACKEIYMLPGTRLGDVAPVGPMRGVILGEKAQSAVRAVLRAYAKERGYPVALTEAMVTKETEVFEVRFQGDVKPAYMTRTEIENLPEALRQKIVERKLAVPAGQLLTMDAEEAERYGFARQVKDRGAFLDAAGLKAEEVAPFAGGGLGLTLRILNALTPVMLVAGLVLLFWEFATPGFAVPGISGMALLVTVFVIKIVVGTASGLEIALLVIGLSLVALEVFVIPGFGVAGVTGILMTLVGAVLAFQDFGWPQSPEQWTELAWNIILVLGSLVVAGVLMAVISRYLERVPFASRLVLKTDLGAARVADAGEGLVGRTGVAVTPLHPGGRVEVGEKIVDVVTAGEWVERGTFVRVTAVEGARVVVEPVGSEEADVGEGEV